MSGMVPGIVRCFGVDVFVDDTVVDAHEVGEDDVVWIAPSWSWMTEVDIEVEMGPVGVPFLAVALGVHVVDLSLIWEPHLVRGEN